MSLSKLAKLESYWYKGSEGGKELRGEGVEGKGYEGKVELY